MLPPAADTIAPAMRRASPVSVPIPTTIPTVAQAQATPIAPRAPLWKASKIRAGVRRVSLLSQESTKLTRMPLKAALSGV